jgi:nucleoid-associated protein YgaU
MASYYKKIKGVRYDRALLDMAESSVKGRGDGRISLADARRLMKLVKDAGTYTDVEQRTIRYIRNKFKFASEADKWFRDEIKMWLAAKKETPKSPPKVAAKAPVKKVARKPARRKAAAKPKKAAVKAPPVKKAAAKPKKVAKPKPESLIDREMARMERERAVKVKAEKDVPPPREKEESKRSFLGAAIIVIVIIIIILIFALWPKKKKPAEEVVKSTTPSEDVGMKEEKVVKEEAAVDEDAQYYTVQVKDNLVKISESLSGDYRNWKKIYDANRDKIKEPTLIYPGQKLIIPGDVKAKE